MESFAYLLRNIISTFVGHKMLNIENAWCVYA